MLRPHATHARIAGSQRANSANSCRRIIISHTFNAAIRRGLRPTQGVRRTSRHTTRKTTRVTVTLEGGSVHPRSRMYGGCTRNVVQIPYRSRTDAVHPAYVRTISIRRHTRTGGLCGVCAGSVRHLAHIRDLGCTDPPPLPRASPSHQFRAQRCYP